MTDYPSGVQESVVRYGIRPEAPAKKRRIRYPRTAAEYLRFKPRDGIKYEWVDGKLYKSKSMVTPDQFYIVENLQRAFSKTKQYDAGDYLMPETKSKTRIDGYRIPDVAYFSVEQKEIMREGESVTPTFAVEIISTNDDAIEVDNKMEEYFKSGVKVVWHIFPKAKKVLVFKSPFDITVCKDESLCSAEPAIEGFILKANQIFN
jgi:Uma2 family endonuclease